MSQSRRAHRTIGAGSSGGRRPPSRTRGLWTESPRCRNIVLRRAARLLCVRCGGNLPVWRGSRPALPRTRRADRRYPDTAVSTGLRILWGDYFKPEHLKTFPELHDLVWKALKSGSKARQEINLQAAEDLLKATNDIASIYWKTKGFETITAKAPYPTERLTVYPKFK